MNDLLLNKINKHFEIEEELNKSILDQLAFYVYYIESQRSQSDLYLLARLLDKKSLYALIDYFDDDIIDMPSKEEYNRSYLLGITFFLKKVIKLNWDQIRNFLKLSPENIDEEDVSSISLGRRINQIEEELLGSIGKNLKKIKVKDIKELLKEVDEANNE